MWAKNIVFYRRDKFSLADLDSRLAKRPCHKPTGLDWFTQGWVSPAIFFDQLAPKIGDYLLVALKRFDKVLPGAVIKAALEEKVNEIELKEARKVGRKEKKQLKEQITDDLLPKALLKESQTYAWLGSDFVFVNAGSHNKAENVLSELREVLPPFPCALPRTNTSPSAAMTDWLASGEAPGNFVLGADVNMQDGSTEGAKVTVRRGDLTADDVRKHIESGKQVTAMSLTWRDRIRFTLTDNMLIKGIKYLDVMQEEVGNEADAAALFDASFRLVSQELEAMVLELVEALGGFEEA